MNIFVTGGSGFIGSKFKSVYKNTYTIHSTSLRNTYVEALDLSNIDCVLHLAAKVHDMKSQVSEAYDEVNFGLTKQLADKAKKQGVQHFVFVSTVKVYGDNTEGVLDEHSACHPDDDYGRSKLKAEEYLQSIANNNFKVAILRPPMVYGPGGKGNMEKLISLCAKGYPLPFANITNRRTLVYIGNLVVFINAIIDHRATGIFIPSDPESTSTTEMIQTIQEVFFKKHKMFAVPSFLRFFHKTV